MIRDQSARERAVGEAGRSFAVEASAGTGKTSILVRRILHLVLEAGPGGDPLPLSRICAITFTEKAAGEMKVRLRQELERAAAAGAGPAAERALRALGEVESASISTFHAFCVSLLKERPIEAGIDPRFSALDDTRARLLFDETWEAWLGPKLSSRDAALEAALRGGFSLDGLGQTTRTLALHGRQVRDLSLPAPPTADEMRQERQAALEEARSLARLAKDPADRLAVCLDTTMRWLADPGSAEFRKPGMAGAAAAWKSGKGDVQRVREFIRELAGMRDRHEQAPAQRILDRVLRWLIGDFLAFWEARKRELGLLDFDDQLTAARDLLASSRAALREFRRRYATLLVDEFQDTDPVQLELVRLLTGTDPDEPHSARLRPAPGRLFLVGDPKQSIYRFRGADIETYLEATAADAIEGSGVERLELTTNFRSVPSILGFVDEVFSGAMTRQENYQPDYLPFGGSGYRRAESGSPAVHILGGRGEADAGGDFRAVEAARIARLLLRMKEGGEWKVACRGGERESWRTPGFGDIAILLPALTHVDRIEEALRGAGVPYVLEGGKYYYARGEVNSAITVLRAVSNPSDAVALYGALRSVFFGLSDEDLLRARVDGLPLDYRVEPPEASPLARPYRILHDLHRRRLARSPAETLETLLASTGAREVLAARGLQSLANLAKLVRTVRAQQEGRTFSEAVRLLASMEAEEFEESESRLMEERSEAVRILSIHRAKGLDFPIVIVAGLGTRIVNRLPDFLSDPHRNRIFALRASCAGGMVATPRWEELSEEEKVRQQAERLRLLYVALTRARDHLVVSVHSKHGEQPVGERRGGRTYLDFLGAVLAGEREPPLAARLDAAAFDAAPSAGKPRPQPFDWSGRLKAETAELKRLIAETPASRPFESPAGRPYEPETPEEAALRSRAVRLGNAFHQVMERIDFSDPEGAAPQAAQAAAAQCLDDAAETTLADMARRVLASPLMERARRAAASGRAWREVPYARAADGSVEEGKIDLVFEEEDGCVLVDYKTDEIPPGPDAAAALRDLYAGQVRRYARALEATGVRVKTACLLLARTGVAVEIPV